MKKVNLKIVFALFASLLITFARGHGIVPISFLQYFWLIGEPVPGIEFSCLFISIGQLIMIPLVFVQRKNIKKILVIISLFTIVTGIFGFWQDALKYDYTAFFVLFTSFPTFILLIFEFKQVKKEVVFLK